MAALLALAGSLGACGGNVSTTNGGGGSAGGNTGGAGGASSTGGGSTGGAGGGIGFTGGGPGCEAFDHVACLNNFPACVPVYDDACCSSCDPGTCADCIHLQFHHCAPKEQGCGSQPPPCGFVPDWACAGGQAACDIDPGGSPEPCGTVAGCVAAECSLDYDCETSPVCVPVTKDICGPSLCNTNAPSCPAGTEPQVKDGCFTTFCVPTALCPPTP